MIHTGVLWSVWAVQLGMTQNAFTPKQAAVSHLFSSLIIGLGSAILFWSVYSRGWGFWWALATTMVGNVAMSALGWWVGRPREEGK